MVPCSRFDLLFISLVASAASCCQGFSSVPRSKASQPILKPSTDENDKNTPFDIGCVANPVVLPPVDIENGGEWQCYYYGNAGSWNFDHPCFLPTGSSGLAVSDDGIAWTKVPGQESGGAILTPSNTQSDWDSVQTGVGDVVRLSENELHMYYFGGSDEALSMGPGSIVGFRMRIGRAKSTDNGRTWVKDNTYLLDFDEKEEGLFASWPRIVPSSKDGEPWKMFYHAFNGKKWRVFSAESIDQGDTWTRTGLVIEGGASEDDFDFSGIGTRDIAPWKDGLLMIYEGVDKSSKHRLGAAFCKAGSTTWNKLNDGEPVLEPGTGPLGEWTKQVIGTPYVVAMPDGSLRVYHCAKDGPDGKMAIGVIESKSGDITPESWESISEAA